MAILTIVISFFTVSYISWAKSVTDQRTLLVLNDALNRYKTEGGGTSGMTYGAQIGGILSKMRAVITYGGRGHQVMQSATTYPARSIAATGSGARYHFTRFNSSQLADYASGDEAGNGGGGNTTHGLVSFTTVGATNWTVPAGVTSVEALVVGGGGFGRSAGGGGGSGGLIHNVSYSVTAGNSITVTVGGGSDGTTGHGGNSVFGTLTAIGGGDGGSGYLGHDAGYSGGSGGGASGWAINAIGGSGTIAQGYAGGASYSSDDGASGGGGGASAVGTDADYDIGGNGGDGLTFSISGSSVYYGGGGGGDARTPGVGGLGGGGDAGVNGTANTGGGGGCGDYSGGSGIVIIKY